MKIIQQKDDAFVLRLSKGEAFKKTLTVFLQEQDIRGAFFYGIGGAIEVTLGYYNLDWQRYTSKIFTGEHVEIINLVGNVAYSKDTKISPIHAHITIANSKFEVFGGHLEELIVGGTLEVSLTILQAMERKLDEDVGLPLFCERNTSRVSTRI